MQIIFDEKLVPELRERYVILELDTVIQPGMEKPMTLYALIDNIDLNTIPKMDSLTKQHQELIDVYKSGKWDSTEFIANSLKGSWRGELDEFYDMVLETARFYRTTNEVWTGVRHTTPIEE
jgi:hypothetical protein